MSEREDPVPFAPPRARPAPGEARTVRTQRVRGAGAS
jgi:hypothetical protein